MKVIYLFKGICGNTRLMKYISNITHLGAHEQVVIRHRLKVIEHYEKYGLDSTRDAYGVSRSVIFLWKSKVAKSGGYLSALKPGNKTPKTRRRRQVDPLMLQFIQQYRQTHHGVGKVTVKAGLDAYCIALGIDAVSESTVGRVIGDLKKKGAIPNFRVTTTINGKTGNLRVREKKPGERKLRVEKGARAKIPGERVQIDAITIFLYGVKRYIICALDVKTRFAFAYAYKTLSSNTAKDFLMKLEQVLPFPIIGIQTDNGHEFHKYFREYAKQQQLIHYFNYPRQPKMNAFVERFNRTIQEQHIGWHMNDLYEPVDFNPGLMKYMIWYNTEKPHRALGNISPLSYYLNNYVDNQQSNMLWTLTPPCHSTSFLAK